MGDVANKARVVAEATGRDVEEVTKEVGAYFQYQYRYWRLISNEMTNMKQGDLVDLPGLPTFYDYEWYPTPAEDVRKTPCYSL